MNYSQLADSPDLNYRDYPEIGELTKDELRQLIFYQGLSAPEVYLGDSPYEGEEANWWYEGKKFWYSQEEGALIDNHPYFKEKDK